MQTRSPINSRCLDKHYTGREIKGMLQFFGRRSDKKSPPNAEDFKGSSARDPQRVRSSPLAPPWQEFHAQNSTHRQSAHSQSPPLAARSESDDSNKQAQAGSQQP